MKAVGHGKATDVYKIVMMGHVMTDITLNIGKTMPPDGVHGEATKRGHYLGMMVLCVGIYGTFMREWYLPIAGCSMVGHSG